MGKQTLHSAGASHARSLIASGKIKDSGSWSAPSADAENAYIKEHGMAAYGKWFLGEDDSEDKDNKGRYGFPFSSDFENVNVRGLAAAEQRASQAGYSSIETEAKKLFDEAKAKTDKDDEEKKKAKSKGETRFRRALARLKDNKRIVRAAEVDGVSMNTLTSDLMDEISEHTKLQDRGDSKEYNWPHLIDIKAPEHEDGEEWTAIVKGADGNMHAVPFEISDGHASFTGEPEQVAHSNQYHFIDENENDSPKKKKSVTPRFYRYAEVRKADMDGKRFQVAFSSEHPVPRTAGKRDAKAGVANEGDEYLEVLSHDDGDYDLSALNHNGAFLDEHDTKDQIGVVRKARVSAKDKVGRASVEFDDASDLAKTRSKQMSDGKRPHISVGYTRTAYLGDVALADGRIAKRFAWKADEISSVAVPADPNAGKDRAAETAEETCRCIGCGDEFPRSELDDDFMCDDCLEDGRSASRAHNAIDSQQIKRKAMSEQIQLQEAEKKGRTQGVTDILARNKRIGDTVDAYIKDHGEKSHPKHGSCESKLRSIANEFCLRGSTEQTETLMAELGQRCLTEIAKFPNETYSLQRAASRRDYENYSLMRAIHAIIERKDHSPTPKDGLELEVHNDMAKKCEMRGEYKSEGLMVPFDAPVHFDSPSRFSRRFQRKAQVERFTRDLQVGQFGAGGALVPDQFILPNIELLRNRTVLDWAGVSELTGLQGNVIIPRQTAPVAPQALAEIAVLNPTQPTFDQVEGRPHRIGNTTIYSRQLLLQSTPNIEALVYDDNFRQMAIAIDEQGLSGQGAGSQPLGLFYTPGIGAITFGGTATLANMILMETTIRQNNVYDPVVYISTSTARGRLRSVPAALIGSTIVSGQTNALWTGMGGEEEVVGRPAFDSQQIQNNQMLCGAFVHFMHLMWGGLNVVVDYWTLATSDEIKVTFNTYNDFICRHPQAFCISTDSAAQ